MNTVIDRIVKCCKEDGFSYIHVLSIQSRHFQPDGIGQWLAARDGSGIRLAGESYSCFLDAAAGTTVG